MKKFNTPFIVLLVTVIQVNAQKIIFNSNGHTSTFQKIDTMYFYEYSGQRPTTKTSAIDTAFSKAIMTFDNSFGFNTRNVNEVDKIQSKFRRAKKLFSTSYYRHSDGTLQAPTSTIFFQPKNAASVAVDFATKGKVRAHDTFKGFYYLSVNTAIYIYIMMVIKYLPFAIAFTKQASCWLLNLFL